MLEYHVEVIGLNERDEIVWVETVGTFGTLEEARHFTDTVDPETYSDGEVTPEFNIWKVTDTTETPVD